MKRLIKFDVLRGFLLLMMVVNHSPSSLRRFTDLAIGVLPIRASAPFFIEPSSNSHLQMLETVGRGNDLKP